MLHSTTTLIETAMVVTPSTTTYKTAGQVVEDEQGNQFAVIDKTKSTIGTTISSALTSATYVGQELSYQNTVNKYRNAAACIESMSDEELAQALIAIDELEASGELEHPKQLVKTTEEQL